MVQRHVAVDVAVAVALVLRLAVARVQLLLLLLAAAHLEQRHAVLRRHDRVAVSVARLARAAAARLLAWLRLLLREARLDAGGGILALALLALAAAGVLARLRGLATLDPRYRLARVATLSFCRHMCLLFPCEQLAEALFRDWL